MAILGRKESVAEPKALDGFFLLRSERFSKTGRKKAFFGLKTSISGLFRVIFGLSPEITTFGRSVANLLFPEKFLIFQSLSLYGNFLLNSKKLMRILEESTCFVCDRS